MDVLLQINIVNNLLSTGKIANGIAAVAESNGWESYIAYGRDAKPGVSREIRVGSMLDEYEHYAEHRLFDNDGLASRCATKRLVRQIEELKPDIIHLHNIHDHYLNYRILFEYLNSIDTPIVWTLHDCWNFTGGCGYYDSIDCMKWKTGCDRCPMKSHKLFDRTRIHYDLKKELFANNKNLTLVPVSNWLAEPLKVSFLKDKPVKVIHNGIDTTVFHPCEVQKVNEKYGLTEKFVVIGVASPWSARKGLNDFVKLSGMLDNSYQIILVGLNDKQIASLPKNVIGIKRTSNAAELAELYSRADVFANPTYSDNFPTTNIEALACGTPVITYKTGGSPEAIDEKTGVVVPQGDVEALAEAIWEMRANPLSREDCRKRAVECFDKEKCFGQYVALYNSLVCNKLTGGGILWIIICKSRPSGTRQSYSSTAQRRIAA